MAWLNCQHLKTEPSFPETAAKHSRSNHCHLLRNATELGKVCLHLCPPLSVAVTFWVVMKDPNQSSVGFIMRQEWKDEEWEVQGKEREREGDLLGYQQNNPYTRVNVKLCEFLVPWLLHLSINMYDLHSFCLSEESPQAVIVVILVLSTPLTF